MIYISNIIQCIFLIEVHISMAILDTKKWLKYWESNASGNI